MGFTAEITVTLLAGTDIPAPVYVTMVVRQDGVPTDLGGARIRRRNPRYVFENLALTRIATGTYRAGSDVSPLQHNVEGVWLYEGGSSVVADAIIPAVWIKRLTWDGFPLTSVQNAPTSTTGQTVKHVVTQAEIDADIPIQVATNIIPSAAVAFISRGTSVSDLVSVDGVSAFVTIAMSDGVNSSPFQDGDTIMITVVD